MALRWREFRGSVCPRRCSRGDIPRPGECTMHARSRTVRPEPFSQHANRVRWTPLNRVPNLSQTPYDSLSRVLALQHGDLFELGIRQEGTEALDKLGE